MFSEKKNVRPIAFYLPQFHTIAENDKWWGAGFTEWRNVTQSTPLFEGHHQPRLPADLGFHDQTHLSTLEKQIALAKAHGVYGFCHYFYWFDGRRILNAPTELFLETPELDMPFCLCWANEHWSRRWDGSESDVLIAQNYDCSKFSKFTKALEPYFSDKRYITVEGDVMFLIYRPQEIPNLPDLIALIREMAVKCGHNGALILGAETFVEYGAWIDPTSLGLDGSVEFPPHGVKIEEYWAKPTGKEEFLGKAFGSLQAYKGALERPSPDYELFRGVFPSWDNTARRGHSATVFTGSSPQLFAYWLDAMVQWTRLKRADGRRFIFINAWNEWAEGAHLEPDLVNGKAFLETTSAIVNGEGVEHPINVKALMEFNHEDKITAIEVHIDTIEYQVGPEAAHDALKAKLAETSKLYSQGVYIYPFKLYFTKPNQWLKDLIAARKLFEFRRAVGNGLRVERPTTNFDRFRNKVFNKIHTYRRR